MLRRIVTPVSRAIRRTASSEQPEPKRLPDLYTVLAEVLGLTKEVVEQGGEMMNSCRFRNPFSKSSSAPRTTR